MTKSKFENNLSRGSVVKNLLIFAVPFIISSFIQSLYNVADMIIVGQFAGTASMSGVNIGGQLSFLLTNLVIGLSSGATVLIGQYLGHGDSKELNETVSTLFTTLAIVAVFMSALMIALRTPLLYMINTPPESFEEAKQYLTVTALGTIFIFGYNAFSAVLRGMGDSKHPMVFVAIACGINVVLDLLFVGVFGWKAFGAAFATVISQAVSMFCCIFYFKKNNFMFDFKLSSFRIHSIRLKTLLKVGIPMSIQNVVVNLSFLILTSMVNTLGVTASAAVGAVGKFNGFAILPAIAMGSSISAVSSHNIGAGESKRAVKTMTTGIIIALAMSIPMFIISQLFPETILRAFANDAEMIAAGTVYMRSFCFDYLFVPVVFCFNGLFIGAGHTTFSLFNGMLSSLFIRVPAAYIFGMSMKWGLLGVGLGAPFASFVALCVAIIYYFTGNWKKSTIINGNDMVDVDI